MWPASLSSCEISCERQAGLRPAGPTLRDGDAYTTTKQSGRAAGLVARR